MATPAWKQQAEENKKKAEAAEQDEDGVCEYQEPVPPNPKALDGVPDMSMLLYLEENHIVYNVKDRYAKDLIYTNISNILVAINPYKQLQNTYGNKIIEAYHKAASRGNVNTMGPHPYGAAEASYRAMCRHMLNQSLIVCGESGAGKTESAKTIMTHLTYITATHTAEDAASAPVLRMPIEQQILAANPILEAFGNARTVLNNNSSRFGKFTKLLFHDVKKAGATIVGSFIETYLLEKSRVTRQTEGERNFHIFYQLFSLDDALKKDYGLTECKDFHYINQSSIMKVAGINDEGRFQELKSAMAMLQLKNAEAVFKSLAAILHIGNVSFKEKKNAAEDGELDEKTLFHITLAAKLLQVDEQALKDRLTTRTIKIRGNVVTKPLSTEDAITNRDAVAKALYHNMFLWVVQQINSELYDPEDDSDDVLWIGILDVFGFECFDVNSFEQFCINFANERLQQYFNVHVVKSEQDEYTIEAIFWTPVNVPDNQDVIDLIDSKPVGLLATLDGACNMPGGDDTTFTANLFEQWASSTRLKQERYPNKKKEARPRGAKLFNGFSIRHFAGRVTYDAEKFLVKNADAVHPDTTDLMAKSETDILREMFPVEEEKETNGKKKGKVSVGRYFSVQLETLMNNLEATEPYFIRCVNPNNIKKAGAFEASYVLKQLRFGGLVEALRILKCGYPSRTTYDALYSRYDSVLASLPKNMNKRDFCEAILAAFELSKKEYQLGLTKVFFRPNQGEFLEMIMREESVTPEIKQKIKDHIIKKRVIRFAGFIEIYARMQRRLVGIRALNMWFSIAGLVHRFNMHLRRRLYAMRRKRAVGTVQAVIRCHIQSRKLEVEYQASQVVETTWRHSVRRRTIAASIEKRCAKNRDDAQRAAAEARRKQEELEMQEKAKAVEAERKRIKEEKEKAEEAAKMTPQGRVHKSDFINDIADAGAAWLAKLLGEKVMNLYTRLQDGIVLCQALDTIDPSLVTKYHTSAPPGSFYARDNVKKFIKVCTKNLNLEKELLFSSKDLAEMETSEFACKNVINGLFNVCLKGCMMFNIEPCPAVEQALSNQEEWEDDETGIRFFGNDDDDDANCYRYTDAGSDKEEEEAPTKEMSALEIARRKKQVTKNRASVMQGKGHTRRKSVLAAKKEARAKAEAKAEDAKEEDAGAEKRDALEEFFCMTTAAVLRKLQETGELDDFKWAEFSAKRLYKQAVVKNVPWHMWHDWIRNRVLARSSEATEGDGDAGAAEAEPAAE